MSEVQKVQSWSPVGKAFSLLQGLYTLARDIYADMSIGMEFLPWLLDEKGGRPHLVERLKELGNKFRAATEAKPEWKPIERIRVLKEKRGRATAIEVNLDAPPFDGAQVDSVIGTGPRSGWVRVERKGKDFYVNNKKVVLFLSELQQNGKNIGGYELKEKLTVLPVLHPNILDALLDHLHLIPEDWKGKLIYFWAVVFRIRGSACVCCLHWDNGRWNRSYFWLTYDWREFSPAASLE